MEREPPIPGRTPLDDTSGLRDRSIRTRADLYEREAENIRKAVMKYLAATPTTRSARFDVPWLRRLHREMLGDVWEWAGAIRKREMNIGSPPHSIESELEQLAQDLKEWERSGMPIVEQGVCLHHRAVGIHPFRDGNGRWARLLANIWLKMHGAAPVIWPEENIGGESTIRSEYLAAMKAADRGDLKPLTRLHEKHSERESY